MAVVHKRLAFFVLAVVFAAVSPAPAGDEMALYDAYYLKYSDLVVEGLVQAVDVEALHVPEYIMADPRLNVPKWVGPGTKYDIYRIRVENVLKGFYPRAVLVVAVVSVMSTEFSAVGRTQWVDDVKSHAGTMVNDRLIVCVKAKPFLRTDTGRFLYKDRAIAWPLVMAEDGMFVFRSDSTNAEGLQEFQGDHLTPVAPEEAPSAAQASPVYAATSDAGWFTAVGGGWVSLETEVTYDRSQIDETLREAGLEAIRERAGLFVEGVVVSEPERIVEWRGGDVAALYEFWMEVKESVPLKGADPPQTGEKIKIRTKQAGSRIPEWAEEFRYLMFVPRLGERWQAFLKLHAEGFYYPFAGANGFFRVHEDGPGGKRLVYQNRVALPYTPDQLLESVRSGDPIQE